ncbi:putative RNA-directed DNA polymerase [Helianthus annuus]|nr:putative RNA-directed DNA polymerase [Helianthus annuus]
MEANTSRIVNLNGSNYHVWKGKMEDLLYVKDYYMPVFNTDKPGDKTDEEWNILHRKVCGYIRQWVDDNVLNHISGETHARTLWNKLEELVLLISLQEWVSSLKTRYKAYGFLVLYRILGRLLGHHCPTLQQMRAGGEVKVEVRVTKRSIVVSLEVSLLIMSVIIVVRKGTQLNSADN